MNNNPQNASQNPHNDEIDLFELIMTLWNNKWTIIGITAVFTVLAIIIALVMSPVYRTKAVIKPIHQDDLYVLNNLQIYSTSPEGLFTDVEKELYSYTNQETFFIDNEALISPILKDTIPERRPQLIDSFISNNLTITPSSKDDIYKHLTLELTYPESLEGPTILNEYLASTIDEIKQTIPDTIMTRIEFQKRDLQNRLAVLLTGYNTQLESKVAKLTEQDRLKELQLNDELIALQETLKKRRQNKIESLNEAIQIAQKLGYKKPTSPSSESNKGISNNLIRAEITQQAMPLYFLGYETLIAERDALMNRQSDQFTSPRITEIEQELALLKNNREIEILKNRDQPDLYLSEISDIKQKLAELSIVERKIEELVLSNLDKLEIVSIDEKALTPLSPIKPNKKLIVIIGVLLGVIIGIGFSLLRQSVGNYRQRKEIA